VGLFSSVIHVHSEGAVRLREALDAEMAERGFGPANVIAVPPGGIDSVRGGHALTADHPSYLVSRGGAPWLTIIEASFAVHGTPWLGELATALSARLHTHTLVMMVHDDDLLLYNLDRDGEALDGYNSCPQYFEKERLSNAEIEDQRHTPEVFRPFLESDAALDEVRELLDRGYWRAYDEGRLDADGVASDVFPFDSEGDRMTELGTLLGIPSRGVRYPFAAWRGSEEIGWSDFELVVYQAGSGGGVQP